MATFNYKTKGDSLPDRKPRVYFTCHPDDFTNHFNDICDDIFKTHDCAVYYTSDMTEEIEEKYLESDLGRMNLFVIPVTYKLLTTSNRAMESDFLFAKEKNIPVLPIIMEKGLDGIYSQADKFGELQYLYPYGRDMSEIKYEDKLEKYLNSVLISDEVAERIRNAFDAYIFLSYRKKDRNYANEFMKVVHSYPEFRDIAVWYDEFLTPGESFRENILKMMNHSKLFALLVTPRILEMVDGEPNYVMKHEYPDAKKAGMDILPTEMEKTDYEELRLKYDGIPDCISPADDDLFKKRLSDTLSKIAVSENNDDPEHNFLIGLAYLEGIDVEKNTERGIELITLSANADCVEAMMKLFDMYNYGHSVRVDYQKASFWANRIVSYCELKYGPDSLELAGAVGMLAKAYEHLGNVKEALNLYEKEYPIQRKMLGEDHPDTLTTQNAILAIKRECGDPALVLELTKTIYEKMKSALGEDDPKTQVASSHLAKTYIKLGKKREAMELIQRNYNAQREIFGDEDENTVLMANALAYVYCEIANEEKSDEYLQKALKIFKKSHEFFNRTHGESHPETLLMLHNIAMTYHDLGSYKKALDTCQNAYNIRCAVLGEEHPDTLETLNVLSGIHHKRGDNEKSLELNKKIYNLRCKVLGEEHPDTIESLVGLSVVHGELGHKNEMLDFLEKAHSLRCKIYGAENVKSMATLSMLVVAYQKLGEYGKGAAKLEKLYKIQCKTLGMEHPETKGSLFLLALTYVKLGDHEKAFELMRKSSSSGQ